MNLFSKNADIKKMPRGTQIIETNYMDAFYRQKDGYDVFHKKTGKKVEPDFFNNRLTAEEIADLKFFYYQEPLSFETYVDVPEGGDLLLYTYQKRWFSQFAGKEVKVTIQEIPPYNE